jgi:hypothetical protein
MSNKMRTERTVDFVREILGDLDRIQWSTGNRNPDWRIEETVTCEEVEIVAIDTPAEKFCYSWKHVLIPCLIYTSE